MSNEGLSKNGKFGESGPLVDGGRITLKGMPGALRPSRNDAGQIRRWQELLKGRLRMLSGMKQIGIMFI